MFNLQHPLLDPIDADGVDRLAIEVRNPPTTFVPPGRLEEGPALEQLDQRLCGHPTTICQEIDARHPWLALRGGCAHREDQASEPRAHPNADRRRDPKRKRRSGL